MTISKKRLQKKGEVSRLPPTEMEPLTRHQMVVQGLIQVHDLDIDELSRSKIKTHEGRWPKGVAPALPGGVLNRMHRELQKRLLQKFDEYGIDAIDTITDVMYRGEGASERMGQKDGTGRFIAAKYILDRVVGPVPTKSENNTTITVWEGLQESADLFVDVEVEEEHHEPPRESGHRQGRRTRRPQEEEG